MAFPYEAVFVALLGAYMVFSEWEGLDSRYPIVAGLVLLVAAAIADAAGAASTANTLAVYVFFLLGAGVILLLVDYVRQARNRPGPVEATRPTDPASASTETRQPPVGGRMAP